MSVCVCGWGRGCSETSDDANCKTIHRRGDSELGTWSLENSRLCEPATRSSHMLMAVWVAPEQCLVHEGYRKAH